MKKELKIFLPFILIMLIGALLENTYYFVFGLAIYGAYGLITKDYDNPRFPLKGISAVLFGLFLISIGLFLFINSIRFGATYLWK